MDAAGRLFDTYAAALRHDLVDLPEYTQCLGVVRRPMPWFSAVVDENIADLGPPPALLEAVKSRQSALLDAGVGDPAAHNRAMRDAEYDRRYAEYIASSDEAQQALESIRTRLRDGESVALVCYENTEKKRCHRTQLRNFVLKDM